MLEVNNITSGYANLTVCSDVSIRVGEGEIVSIVGANGAGKTTLLRTISGILPYRQGSVAFDGADITKASPYEIVQRGLLQVAGMESIFAPMTVWENLMVSIYPFKKKYSSKKIQEQFEYVYDLFPRLKERAQQKAGTLSGGERQMLALAMALICQPKMLMLDEPSLGLAPVIVDQLFEVIRRIHEEGYTVLLVEQNVDLALGISNHGYVLDVGEIVLEDSSEALLNNPKVKDVYLGIV